MGRTGKWFAHQYSGVEPDIMTMSKSLGGGVAIGALMATEDVAASLVPGTHASTFGGNPLACSAAIATIEVIDRENLLENAERMGAHAQQKLTELQQKHCCIDHVRGIGLMIGIQLTEDGSEIVSKCWQNGLRINCTHETVLRFMPAMNVTEDLIDQAVGILDNVIGENYSEGS